MLAREFSELNIIKANKQALLGNQTLNDLLTVNAGKKITRRFYSH